MKHFFNLTALGLTISILLTQSLLIGVRPASALNGSDFKAGRIIDDRLFFDGGAMSAHDIQVFLNSKVPVCDTWHAGSGSNQPPFTCLKDFRQDIPTMNPDQYCASGISGGNKSAAEIIRDVALACSVSPKSLIVLLQKEQSLITDTWPWNYQYKFATGFCVFDTGPPPPACAGTDGFFNQIYYAARQFQRYKVQGSYRANQANHVQYHPNAACGGKAIFIQNQATAGLYNYIPYQPNPAALNNLYGAGDDCSAYGNRNFWRLFHGWFGSPYADCVFPNTKVSGGLYRLYNPYTYNHLITSSSLEVCTATAMGFLYDGQMLAAGSSSNKPVYRLHKDGRYLYTLSGAEIDFAVRHLGFQLEAIAFYGVDENADPTNARPVYRLVNTRGYYTYTISAAERDLLTRSGYAYEGIAFYLKENPGAAVTAAYRLRNAKGAYLYTISAAERDFATQFYGYNDEGTAFNAISQLNSLTIPVYRLATKNGYLYTASLTERLAAMGVGYRDEGVSMYTYGFSDPSLKAVHRLVHPSNSYFFTTSNAENEWAARNAWYIKEGIGFRTP